MKEFKVVRITTTTKYESMDVNAKDENDAKKKAWLKDKWQEFSEAEITNIEVYSDEESH